MNKPLLDVCLIIIFCLLGPRFNSIIMAVVYGFCLGIVIPIITSLIFFKENK